MDSITSAPTVKEFQRAIFENNVGAIEDEDVKSMDAKKQTGTTLSELSAEKLEIRQGRPDGRFKMPATKEKIQTKEAKYAKLRMKEKSKQYV